eukprot:GILI01004948.1.p1 GENE.GILI01004948.1~~GILI01004948.1.p1  ORF type:complete len:533 (+),score=164.47 GILI01004948.1:109-1707(+)
MKLASVVVLLLLATRALGQRHRFHPMPAASDPSPPYSVNDCEEHYFTQTLDHFSFESNQTFQQRYYVCKRQNWWKGNGAPVFFYTGNEASVELYVNMTGLMWENAQSFGAALVFAEHRYFGKSLPVPNTPMPPVADLKYLTTDQAMMDYSTLISWIRNDWNATDSAFIGFGGSYGGMLCAWTRSKYPSALDGCVAGSAPVIDFMGMQPELDYAGFAEIETFDASTAGGSNDLCKININTVMMDLYNCNDAATAAKIATAMNVCEPTQQISGNTMLNAWGNVIGDFAMGSYPYPSAYMLMGGGGELPAYPMRQACSFLSQPFPSGANDDKTALYTAFGQAMLIYYEAAGSVSCINVNQDVNEATQIVDYLWGYLACTDMLMIQTQSGNLNLPNGKGDMLYPLPFNLAESEEYCQQTYGVYPSANWVTVSFGGRQLIETATNIIFNNGELDPWRFGGFVEDAPNKAKFNPKNNVALVKNAGHHMELMFSNPADSQTNVADVRKLILSEIQQWISEKAGTVPQMNIGKRGTARLH